MLEFSIREDLRYRLQRSANHYVCLVAIQHFATADSVEPKIVGTVEMSARSLPAWWPSDRLTYLSNLAVDRRSRRLGVARKLLAACEHISLDWGVSTLSLHVMADNTPARQLYHQAGFSLQRQGGIGGLFQSSSRLLLHKDLV
ncbi:MAG: GNAT family N-acetyltransferase [Elainellaceae cyanobacterium]